MNINSWRQRLSRTVLHLRPLRSIVPHSGADPPSLPADKTAHLNLLKDKFRSHAITSCSKTSSIIAALTASLNSVLGARNDAFFLYLRSVSPSGRSRLALLPSLSGFADSCLPTFSSSARAGAVRAPAVLLSLLTLDLDLDLAMWTSVLSGVCFCLRPLNENEAQSHTSVER